MVREVELLPQRDSEVSDKRVLVCLVFQFSAVNSWIV